MIRRVSQLFLFFLAGVYVHAQTADEIINKYVKFIGGEKQWKAVKTMITSGEYTYGGVTFPFKSYHKAPNLYRFTVTLNEKYYAQAFDGKSGWKIDVFNGETVPTLLNGKAAMAMANEANVELEDTLINYKGKGHQVSLEGKDSVKGKSCFKIKITYKNGETDTCYFEENTGELFLKRAAAKNPELGGARLIISYSDYAEVNGIKVPFKTIFKTDDQTILTIVTKKIEINKAVSDTEFQPPKSK